MSQGTIDGAQVHIREVVRAALIHNAASCIIVHNHPSRSRTPSEADKRLTYRVRDALAVVDIRLLDHIIVAGMDTVSFVGRRLL